MMTTQRLTKELRLFNAEKEIIEWTLSDREREIIAGLGKFGA